MIERVVLPRTQVDLAKEISDLDFAVEEAAGSIEEAITVLPLSKIETFQALWVVTTIPVGFKALCL